MAVTSQKSIVLYWGPDFDAGPWGASTLTGLVHVGRPWATAPTSLLPVFKSGLRLASGQTTGTYRTFVRTLGALHSWGPCVPILQPGAPTDVKVRIWDGAADLYWNGSAWVEPSTSAHWNTAAEVYAAMPAYTGRSLGFTVQLSRASATAESPVLAGIAVLGRVLFIQTSADETRASSWNDDVLRRILIRRARQMLICEGAEEPTAPGASLAFGAGVGELPIDVIGVEAVFDITADPTLRSPLAGAWNAGAKTWTPTAPFPAGHRIHARYQFRPLVVHSADLDFFEDRLPCVVFENIEPAGRQSPTGEIPLVNEATGAAVVVRAPGYEDLRITGRILAARTTDRDRVIEIMREWLEDGTVELSPSTSLPVVLALQPDMPSGPVIGDHSDTRFTILASRQDWPGLERTAHVLIPGGWMPTATATEE